MKNKVENLDKQSASEPNIPEISFTEDEHKSLVDYLNFVHAYAKFADMTQGDAYRLGQLYVKTANVSKKIEGYILEFKKLTKTGK